MQVALGDAAVARDAACVEFRIVEVAADVGHHPLQHDLPAASGAGLGLRAQRGGQQFHAGMQHVARVAARQLAEARVERDEVVDEQPAEAAGGREAAADELAGARQREQQFALRHREGDLPQARAGDEGHRACAVPEREAARVQREFLAIDRQADRPLGDVDQVVERLAVLRHLARTARADDAALGGGEVRDAKAVEAALADEGREALAADRPDRPVQVASMTKSRQQSNCLLGATRSVDQTAGSSQRSTSDEICLSTSGLLLAAADGRGGCEPS
nr:hypothetical protein [Methylibium sp. T29-B]